MKLLFEWDSRKAETNVLKHDVSFEEAATVFGDVHSFTINDPIHSIHEKRFVTLGLSVKDRLLAVVHTDRGERIRIISARRASRRERKEYYYEEKK